LPDLLRELAVADLAVRGYQDTASRLLAVATRVVPACLAVTLTLQWHDQPITCTVLVEGASPAMALSSLTIDLPSLHDRPVDTPPRLILYARYAGALNELAVELRTLLDIDPRRSTLDQDLPLPCVIGAADTLRQTLVEGAAVDRALGLLLDRDGLLGPDARHQLADMAAHNGTSVAQAACSLLTQSIEAAPAR
jgi:hypothetical protein